jgi:hypothetical protein
MRARVGSDSIANVLRSMAGGTIEAPPRVVDKVHEILLEYASEFYALFLIPPDNKFPNPFQPELSRASFTHPRKEELLQAILADASLVRLFGGADTSKGTMHVSGYVLSSHGRGNTVQLATLPELILRNAWHLALLSNKKPSRNQFRDAVVAVIAQLRTAVNGRAVTIPVRVGLTGVKLPDGIGEITLPWGKMRVASSKDDELVPAALQEGTTGTTTAGGKPVTIRHAGDIILETELPYRIVAKDASRVLGGMPFPFPADFKDQETLQQRIETIQLALLLATKREGPRPRVKQAWTADMDPIGFGYSTSWRNPYDLQGIPPIELSLEEANSWKVWCGRIDAHRVPSIQVAIRRTLLAEIERKDPIDVLVDAVTAWENLVGSDKGELRLRVSAALAWLLGKDTAEREVLQATLKDLYDHRSRAVHGSDKLKPEDAQKKSAEAVSIALRALQVLFKNRTELLDDCEDSDARSIRLILGN